MKDAAGTDLGAFKRVHPVTVERCANGKCSYKSGATTVRGGEEWRVCDKCTYLNQKPPKPGKPARFLAPA